MDILRFITAGSIDDGKSTLIGRLLLDTQNIKSDILDSVTAPENGNELNLAYITDGLRAERQAGITIDVAYKYFTTPTRKYIITDAPGHFQYTKNLVTGASGVDVMIILIDAVNGILAQTRRHSLVASFLGIRNIVVAVNKMDLVGFDENVFNNIRNEFRQIAASLQLQNICYIPLSALNGDNLTFHSSLMPWYTGETLFSYLRDCDPHPSSDSLNTRFIVQYTKDELVFGKLVSGSILSGDTVYSVKTGQSAIVESIINNDAPDNNICMKLSSIQFKRGSVLSHVHNQPQCTNEFEANLCWLDDTTPLQPGREYLLRINTAEILCTITSIISRTNNDTYAQEPAPASISANDFARVRIRTNEKAVFDNYSLIRETGRGIIIDCNTNNTSGALVIG